MIGWNGRKSEREDREKRFSEVMNEKKESKMETHKQERNGKENEGIMEKE